MSSRRRASLLASLMAALGLASASYAQQAPPPSAARILLLPRKIVSGERATLAVLDLNGRLTPGVIVKFSNGDHFTTDPTGRALFVAPLNPGTIFGSIDGRQGRVPMVVVSPTKAAANLAGMTPAPLSPSSASGDENPSSALSGAVTAAPRFASLSDRFDVAGSGFCGDADANTVSIAGKRALVLASSPTSLVVLPPAELEPGPATVAIKCGKNNISTFSMVFLDLELHGDTSPLAAGQHRQITVSIAGSSAKIPLEAKNLAPDIAELSGGTIVRRTSTGGPQNVVHFETIGRHHGNFLISVRLIPALIRPSP